MAGEDEQRLSRGRSGNGRGSGGAKKTRLGGKLASRRKKNRFTTVENGKRFLGDEGKTHALDQNPCQGGSQFFTERDGFRKKKRFEDDMFWEGET